MPVGKLRTLKPCVDNQLAITYAVALHDRERDLISCKKLVLIPLILPKAVTAVIRCRSPNNLIYTTLTDSLGNRAT